MSRPTDWDRVGAAWRALEPAAAGGFFRSWLWVGCLAAERYADPVLLEARQDGAVVALGLLNRRKRALWLGQTGDPGWDSVFVEHNGLLLHAGAGADVEAACLAALLRGRLVLSGVSAATMRAAAQAGVAECRQIRAAPWVDLARLGGGYLGALSANTRQQLRRSQRRFAAMGAVQVTRAEGAAERLAFLHALAVLHQRTWEGRGKPGAFAGPAFRRFHDALAGDPAADGHVDLLRISAGGVPLGYLYNFRYGGEVSAYQSGFDYGLGDGQRKPGMTCHHLAIERGLAEGMARYDFLGGADRYKTSMATDSTDLCWGEAAARWSAAGLMLRARRRLRGT